MQQENLQKKIFKDAFKEFIIYCRVKNLSSSTNDYYEECYGYFTGFFDEGNLVNEITENKINEYILWLKNTTKLNDISINTRLRGLRTILYYFMKLGYLKKFEINLIKADKNIYETYTPQELDLLLKKQNVKDCQFSDFRNWAISCTLLATGVRAGTLINIKKEDIDLDNDLIKLTKMKGRRQNMMPISNTLHKVLAEYMKYRGGEDTDYLFCSQYGDKLTVNALGHSIRKYNRKRCVAKTGLHLYRHTFAKLYLESGGNIFNLQKLLSHSSLDMVKNYINIFTKDLQKNFNELNPLEQMQKSEKKHISLSTKRGGK